LQGLVKPLGLALGLRVAGSPVLLADAEERQEVFEGVATAGEAGGVDAAVVGQRAGGSAVVVDGGQEGADDVVAAVDGLARHAPRAALVVVEDAIRALEPARGRALLTEWAARGIRLATAETITA